ncbi:MAG: VC_2705 family sodium/solute symporter, partial [Phycisphaerales bacterium]|nr:VC_2705 family sodium/solute symporter [Phycisphaerales bacterium]
AQYCVLIFAFMTPAIFISILLTNNPVPQLGFGGQLAGDVGTQIAGGQNISLLDKLDGLHEELGFAAYTSGKRALIDMFAITMALMVGTAGLPHVIVRFYTVPRVRDARISAGWALLFIAILYTTAPAVAAFARTNLIATINEAWYSADAAPDDALIAPEWFRKWENTGLVAWVDKNDDGRIQYRSGNAFDGGIEFATAPDGQPARGVHGERLLTSAPSASANELYVNRDIMVLANPEIARLPNWVVGLVAAGGLAAALSTAAGLLLVISTAVSHDLLKRTIMPSISEKGELRAARVAAAAAVMVAGYFGIDSPGFVAEVVAFAFGLAASSFFPVIILGIFWKRMSREGAIAGMLTGITFTAAYIIHFKYRVPGQDNPDHWLLGISTTGIGTIGMLINFVVSVLVSLVTPPPPEEVQRMIEEIRVPRGSGEPHEISA